MAKKGGWAWPMILAAAGVVIWRVLPSETSADNKPKPGSPECRAELRCWAETHILTATTACREKIERLPRYSSRWVGQWHAPKLTHYRWASKDAGTVTYVGDRLEVQNASGAWQPHVYECDFDPTEKRVLDARAQPGRL